MTYPFQWQAQPSGNTCGQTVLSMITGEPVERIISEIGKRKTWPKDLQEFLAKRNWIMRPCGIRLPEKPKTTAVLFAQMIVANRLIGHWVLWNGFTYLDPSFELRADFGSEVRGSFYEVLRIDA